MFLYLIIREPKDLESILESGLSSFSLSKVIDNPLIWVGLLNIIVVEVNNGITIREHFPLHTIVE